MRESQARKPKLAWSRNAVERLREDFVHRPYKTCDRLKQVEVALQNGMDTRLKQVEVVLQKDLETRLKQMEEKQKDGLKQLEKTV